MTLNLIGVGSRAARDDEVGLLLVEAIAQQNPPDVRIGIWEQVDAAGIAQQLLDMHDPVLLVDCADMGIASGQMRCFQFADIRPNLRGGAVSTHGFGLADAVELARALGFDEQIAVIGIQPYDLSPACGLTRQMRERFDILLEGVRREVLALAGKS